MASFSLADARGNVRDYELPTDLTMGEMCDAEQYFGVEFGNAASSGARMAAALMWIAVRRADPTVTPDEIREAIRDLPLDVIASFAEGDAGPPAEENSAASESSGESSRSDGESQGNGHQATGVPGSESFSASDLATSRS